jgi:hypothetical protein
MRAYLFGLETKNPLTFVRGFILAEGEGLIKIDP